MDFGNPDAPFLFMEMPDLGGEGNFRISFVFCVTPFKIAFVSLN
jgi:hypothetical protein